MRIIKHLLCLIPFLTVGQIPNHIVLGEKQFSNIDIYDVHIDSKNKLRVATNDGIFVYKMNQFEKLVLSPEQRGNSFFDIQESPNHKVYAKNIKGQLFEISSDTINLHYELHEDQQNSHFFYFIDEENLIHISSIDFYTIDEQLNRKIIFQSTKNIVTNNKSPITINKFKGSNEVYLKSPDKFGKPLMYIYSNKNFEKFNYRKYINHLGDQRPIAPEISKVNETIVLIDKKGNIKAVDPQKRVDAPSREGEAYYRLNDGQIIALDDSKGFRLIYEKNDTICAGETLFPNTFISSCFHGHGDQLYLGTFGGGLIIVPNLSAVKMNLDELLLGVTLNSLNSIFISTRSGKIYEFKDDLKQISHKVDNIDYLVHLKNKIIDFDGTPTHLLSSVTPQTSRLKDFYETDSGVWAIDNNGLVFIPFENDSTKIPTYLTKELKGKQMRGTLKINDFDGFSHIASNQSNQTIYFNNYKHLFKLINGKAEIITLIKDDIISTDIEILNDLVILGSQNHGIILLKNDKVFKILDMDNGLQSNSIKKIQLVGNSLFVLSNKGLQIVDLRSFKVHSLGLLEGIRNDLISNFAVNRNQLTLIEKDGFYSISLNQLKNETPKNHLDFEIVSIQINEKTFETYSDNFFKHTENAIRFNLDYLYHINKEEAFYTYQLIGFDKELQHLSTLQNQIFYQSLPPGDYTFEIGLTFRGKHSESQKFSFSILPPFWQRWWFYVLIVLLAGLIIFFLQQRKLKMQAREALMINELNSSKLTAIQSQMNPHFVFNALNSIQHLVIEGETNQAYNYITRFANLVRKTLEFSEVETISISQEIELLEIYLKLEKLRFGDDFEYKIEADNIINCNVPPMLIQPFIENSLVHGLLHKRGRKKLLIQLEIHGEILHCKIFDNGIGREESKKINARYQNKPKSFALRAIDNRFRILQKYSESKIGYSYIDLEGVEFKTVVNMRIPIAETTLPKS